MQLHALAEAEARLAEHVEALSTVEKEVCFFSFDLGVKSWLGKNRDAVEEDLFVRDLSKALTTGLDNLFWLS